MGVEAGVFPASDGPPDGPDDARVADHPRREFRLPILCAKSRPILHLQRRGAMKLTIIHPCIGRRPGVDFIRSWQMEPLSAAYLAALAAPHAEVAFYGDRMETIPYDAP